MKDWCLEVWGDYACFTRPEMKVERVSYDVMTPSAARAVFEAILWKPAIKWHVTKIEVLAPIRWISVRRNEVEKICNSPGQSFLDGTNKKPLCLYIEENRQQRAGLFLRNVHYRIHAWFEFIAPEKRNRNKISSNEYWADDEEQHQAANSDETEAKYAAMFERRAKKGQCFHRPYLGCREFACNFRLMQDNDSGIDAINVNEELGRMLYDINYNDPENPKPEFFKASLVKGVINTDRRTVEVRS